MSFGDDTLDPDNETPDHNHRIAELEERLAKLESWLQEQFAYGEIKINTEPVKTSPVQGEASANPSAAV